MIVDTSALIAVLTGEPGHDSIFEAMLGEPCAVAAPTLLEFMTVARGDRFKLGEQAEMLIVRLGRVGLETVAWTADHAGIAVKAQLAYGKGNGRGGVLNLLDLMVYAVAKERGETLLFTGRDFGTTDIRVHPASRLL